MTQYKPFIFINRLVITKGKYTVYDEIFHKGVNIIRGTNSSGKSTIMDFLFFSLGGNIVEKQWKVIALKCDNTYIEVNINNQIFVLHRQVSTNSKEPMRIYEGSYDNAIHSSLSDWLSFPYASTSNKESFHDNLLKLLDIPVIKSKESSYVNINQILRLVYTDQLSSISRIFREEDFDSSFKRETIGDLMLGVNSLDLTQKKLEIIQTDKNLSKIVSDIRAFTTMYGEIESKDSFDKKIIDNEKEMERLTTLLYSINNINNESLDKTTEIIIADKRQKFETLLQNKTDLLQTINTLNFEIIDSENFIKNLKDRLKNIQDSESTMAILSDINFTYCPSCFTRISLLSNDNHSCCLCKSTSDDNYESPTFRIRKDIEFQISETAELIPKFKIELEESISTYTEVIEKSKITKNEILILEKPISGTSPEKSDILMNIGRLQQENLELSKKHTVLHKLYETQNSRDSEQSKLDRLKDEISSKESLIISNRTRRKNLVSSIALELLLKDLNREDGFHNPKEIDFDFGNDRIKVDNVSNFSASSTAFLKTILKLSILIASCKNSEFLYPRLAIIDNVEDKGMEEARSQNLQKIIIEESNRLEVEHQIIFTTSMIDPLLDDSEYCVGDYYDSKNRTLNIIPS